MSQTEPKTYSEASKYECWKQTMQLELSAFKKTGTWKLVDLPPNVITIGCRCIYKIKYVENGSIDRFKDILVAKEYN